MQSFIVYFFKFKILFPFFKFKILFHSWSAYVDLKLHSHGRLLAARIGILSFFFLNCSCFFSQFEKEKRGKMPILAATVKAARVNVA